jgi:glycosidase
MEIMRIAMNVRRFASTCAAVLLASLATAPSQPASAASSLDFVGLLFPRGGTATQLQQGAFSGDSFDIYVQVYEPGLTERAGANAAIQCTLHWGKYGAPWSDVPMRWHKQIGNNDEYRARLSRAQMNKLALGRHGFTANCKKSGERDVRWKQNSSDINGKAGDNDIGDGQLLVTPPAGPSPEAIGGVFVQLFEWKWNDIAKECVYLGQKGYWAVQVSPPMEHVPPRENMFGVSGNDFPWWVRYQPVTHDSSKLISRSGSADEFKAMLKACDTAGVGIIVDAVINHTTGVGSGKGTAGSSFSEYAYPQYTREDFHSCGTSNGDIQSYQNREQVQTCELVGLADLNTASPKVRTTLHKYLQDFLDMGVLGFRIDAAKHVAAEDIAAILDGLKRPDGRAPYIFQEVIDPGTEPIKSTEYVAYGDVTEFRYSIQLGAVLNGCQGASLAQLKTLTETMLPANVAVVFTDNHDNQRGHGAGGKCVLDHRDGNARYNLGNAFMLAFPYGHPAVMSSYYWSNDPDSNSGDSKGPPSASAPYLSGSGPDTRSVYGADQEAGEPPTNCSDSYEDGKWVCEHRRTAIANMVRFRAATAGEPVTNWQVIGDALSNHIAFGRGTKGFVALNNTDSAAKTSYQSSLPAGKYCNIAKYDFINNACVTPSGASAPAEGVISVDAKGRIVDQTLDAGAVLAIHIGAVLK